MKYSDAPLLDTARLHEAQRLGARIAELRHAYRLRQADVAARAGLSRATAVLIEKGDVGRTLGQLLRYICAIHPDVTLQALLNDEVTAITMNRAQSRTRRVRPLSGEELEELDF